jgi:D-xylose 1-dehydrogenase (NADP+, D-xylono-1,5-lactone-forming)
VTALRWGVLSTGSIASMVVRATRDSTVTDFVAVASRGGDRAERFAAEHGVVHAFGSYEDLLASDVVDAVYVALPPSLHAEWTVRALEAGKHVLCEKPFVLTEADAVRAFDTAEAADRLLVEGFMYRLHPQTELLEKLLAEGVVGDVRLVRTALSIATAEGDIRRSRSLGGGALHDLGGYCLSATRLVAGEPLQVYAEAVLDDDGVDLVLGATLRMPAGVIAQLDVGLLHTRRDELEVVGSDGTLVVPDPWVCRAGRVEIRRGAEVEVMEVEVPAGYAIGREEDVYRIELDRVSAAITSGTALPFGRDDAVAQARALEALRTSYETGGSVTLAATPTSGAPTTASPA